MGNRNKPGGRLPLNTDIMSAGIRPHEERTFEDNFRDAQGHQQISPEQTEEPAWKVILICSGVVAGALGLFIGISAFVEAMYQIF